MDPTSRLNSESCNEIFSHENHFIIEQSVANVVSNIHFTDVAALLTTCEDKSFGSDLVGKHCVEYIYNWNIAIIVPNYSSDCAYQVKKW